MLHNSVSVDTNVYTLQPKQKSIAGVFQGFLQNFRTASLENSFQGMLLKRKQCRGRARNDPCGFRFSFSPGQLFISHKTSYFIISHLISAQWSLSICIMLSIFVNLRKGLVFQLLLSRLQWQKYLIAIRQIIKVLHGNIPCVNECTVMPPVNNVTKSTLI